MWQQYGETSPDEGAVGGDIQAGRAPGKRFVNPEKPGAVFDVMAYPIFGDGTRMQMRETPFPKQRTGEQEKKKDV